MCIHNKQCLPVISVYPWRSYSQWLWKSVYQCTLQNGTSALWNHSEHEQWWWKMPWQRTLRGCADENERGTPIWQIRYEKDDGRGTENLDMEIFHDLLEHPEDLLSQWRTASHAKAVWYSNLKDLHRFESLRQKNKQTILNNGGEFWLMNLWMTDIRSYATK